MLVQAGHVGVRYDKYCHHDEHDYEHVRQVSENLRYSRMAEEGSYELNGYGADDHDDLRTGVEDRSFSAEHRLDDEHDYDETLDLEADLGDPVEK